MRISKKLMALAMVATMALASSSSAFAATWRGTPSGGGAYLSCSTTFAYAQTSTSLASSTGSVRLTVYGTSGSILYQETAKKASLAERSYSSSAGAIDRAVSWHYVIFSDGSSGSGVYGSASS